MALSMKHTKLPVVAVCFAGGLLVGLAGCGPPDLVGPTHTVKGKITLKGAPANHGGVTFWPDTAKGNTSKFEASGAIKPDGTYTMHTRTKPGVPPGAYKVTVTITTKVESTAPTDAKLEIPKEYTLEKKTPLTAEVVASPAAGAYDFDVK
jgi:hypothetical protein